jgi:hypothetical protein
MDYVVLPRELLGLRPKKVSGLTLRALRQAVSREWRGRGAVEEIRAQRKR